MANNDPFNVKTELTDGIDSMARFSGPDGNLHSQRLALHELIVQVVSERKILSSPSGKYGATIKNVITEALKLKSYQELEKAGDYTPEKISSVLDEFGLERLPLHDRAKQMMMVTGGPGTGKSSLVSEFAKAQPEIYQNAVQINPDDYKDILANPKKVGTSHSEYTHKESSLIAKKIMGRLDERMAAGLPAPHVVMDVVSPNPERMAFAKRFEQMKVSHGTAPPEVTLQRAYDRGFDTDGKIHGRVIDSRVVLKGAAKASELLPNVFEHPNLEFKMVDTDVPFGSEQLVIAEWDNHSKRLAVYDPDTFVDFVQRQHINTSATHAGELLQNYEQTPERLAADLKPYTDKGVQIDFMDSDRKPAISISADKVEVHSNLPSKHGSGFMADMAETFGRLGKNGGVIAGVTFGTLSGAFTLAAGGNSAQAAEAVYEAAVPYGETSLDAVRGDVEAMKRSGLIETVSNGGSLAGIAAGAAAGAAIGSAIPVIGTVAGAAVGGVIGGLGGGVTAGYITEKVYDNFETIKNGAVYVSNEAADALNVAVRETASLWDWLRGNDEPENDRLLARLPTEIDDTAPPELQHLVEIKRLLVQAREEGASPEKIDSIEEMFGRACDTYEKNGALEMAVASLDQWEHAEQMAQVLIDDIKNKTAKSTEQYVIQSKNDLVFGQ
ncbi:Zeta toxin [Nitrosomonas sp. Nm51]|uniref:zeta toxin family protein n=1 Tax=Nitrosomonas sp. Nm51 TaxID=133720 RepID=UPI0008ACAF94|nr:zeta toxin family protein [Nitrosomonas sp. Nm51]SER81860.1 Zeta toxin [Nitrosomonas sp. Nm51]